MGYYKPCPALDRCNELIDNFFLKEDYKPCFEGHLELAQQGYPLAECQVGYFYLEGLGVEKDLEQAFCWTKRAAEHGDWDAQYNLGEFYETGIGTEPDPEQAKQWYQKAARQGHDLAMDKCKALGIPMEAEKRVELYVPKLEELWFDQKMQADPATMSYNANWDVSYSGYHRDTGCIDFPESEWADWYAGWIGREPERFYAYIRRVSDGQWLGNVNFHYTPDRDWWDMGIVLYAPYRGQGYAVPALRLLLDHAFRDCGVTRIHNNFEIARNEVSAWKTHLSAGFRDVGIENGFREMMVTREEYLILFLD
ncbi:MAG: GNAT family N-acetyltransferase [Candidatus Avoscillospira sp.]